MKLRLFHHRDGARVAYRETGTGPGLVLLHSALLSHKEWEPVVEDLSDRFRLVLPDLPLHGDSEDRPRHPYTLAWLAEVMAAFCLETAGPAPLVGGHDLGAEVLLRAVESGAARAGEARADAQLPAPAAGARRAALDVAGDDARGRGPGPRPRPQPRRAARVPPRPRGEAQRAREPGGARPRPPRVRRRRRQREPRALVGDVRARATRSARAASCSTRTRGSPRRRCSCGPTRTRCTRSRRPRRRSTCCPTRSCACSAGPGS